MITNHYPDDDVDQKITISKRRGTYSPQLHSLIFWGFIETEKLKIKDIDFGDANLDAPKLSSENDDSVNSPEKIRINEIQLEIDFGIIFQENPLPKQKTSKIQEISPESLLSYYFELLKNEVESSRKINDHNQWRFKKSILSDEYRSMINKFSITDPRSKWDSFSSKYPIISKIIKPLIFEISRVENDILKRHFLFRLRSIIDEFPLIFGVQI